MQRRLFHDTTVVVLDSHVVVTLVSLLAFGSEVQATPYYWDIDQATAGAGGGASPTGTWSTAATTLSTDINGTSAVVAHTTGTGDSITFSAGATATGAYTVTVSGAQNIGSLTFEDGLPSLTGSAINFNNGAGTGTFNVNVNTDINNVIGGANLVKNGTGTLTWSGTGTNTYTASLTVNAGTLNLKGQHTDDGNARVLTIQNNSTVNLQAGATETLIGSDQLNMGGSVAGTQNFNVAGTLNLHGSNSTIIAQNAASLTSTMTIQNGGVVDVTTANFILGNNNATASGTLTVQAGGSITINSSAGAISLGRAGATGTLNLDGGTFSTGLTILGSNSGTTGTATVNFNGGALKAITANNANWVNPSSNGGTGRANVKAGGAVFDTNGFSMGISQALLHDPALGATLDGGLTKIGAGTLTLSGANTYTGVTRVITGTLTVTGNETAANGGWNIGDSSNTTTQTVNFNSGSTIAVAAGKTFQLGHTAASGLAATLNVAGTVDNDGQLNVQRSALLNINSGGIWTQSGAMLVAAPGGSGISTSMTVNSGGSFTYDNSSTSLIQISPASGAAGNSTLTVSGTFTTNQGFTDTVVTSSGSANIVLAGGTLKLSADVPVLTATAGSTFNFTLGTGGGTIDTNGFSTTMNKVIDGSTALTKISAGTLTLDGANSYTGATAVNGGMVKLGNATALGTTAGNTTIASGATVDLNGQTIAEPFGTIAGTGVGANGALINSSGSAASITGTISAGTSSFTVGAGNITLANVSGTGTFTVTKVGAGTLTLAGAADNSFLGLTVGAGAGTVVLGKPRSTSAIHAVGRPIVINGGTVQLGGGGGDQIFDNVAAPVTVSGGTFDINTRNETVGGVTLTSGNITGTSGVLTLGAGATNYDMQSGSASAILAGAVGLNKTTGGTVTLSGANTFTGNATVTGGALNLSNSLALQNSTLTTAGVVFDSPGCPVMAWW